MTEIDGMTLQKLFSVAAIAAITTFAPAVGGAASSSATIEEQIQALRQLVERQQTQLDEQQRQLSSQRAELDQLRTAYAEVPVVPPTDSATRLESVERSVAQSKLDAQENPKVTFDANRATIRSVDGRSAIAVRANVQMDYAHYDQSPASPPETDYRRGSVGAGSRENDAARDLSDGAYFRRARFGVQDTIARDFNYRFLVELGGAGTEGPTRINDAYLAYTAWTARG